MKNSRVQIGFLWLVGVLAAAQLSRMAMLAPVLREDFDLSIAEACLLISLLEVGGALFGIVAGILIGRIGSRRFLFAGLLILVIAGAAQALAPSPAALFTARAVEGVGYALVVVAAPTMIAAIADEQQRGPALALWGTFVPLGVALGSMITGALAMVTDVPGVLLFWAAASLCALGLATRLPVASGEASQGLRMPHSAAWLSAASFGLYTTLVCALTALLPLYVVERQGASLAGASALAGAVSFAALPGCVMIMLLLHRGFMGPARMMAVAAVPLLMSALPAVAIFSERALASGLVGTAGLAIVTVLLGGFTPPYILARLPRHAGSGAGDDPRLAAAQGLLTQFGAGGALIGPPVAGHVAGAHGWTALGDFLAALTVSAAVVMLAAEWLTRQREGALAGPEWSGEP